MSLINDALKKAQRQRTNNPFGINPPMPGGGGRVAKRSGMPPQTIILIVAGCAVLVVLSALGAVFFVNGKRTPATNSSTFAAAPAATVETANPKTEFPTLAIAPLTVPTRIEPVPADNASVAPTPVPTEIKPEPLAAASVASTKAAAPEPKVAAVKAATVPAGPDERVHAFLDALRITGVRTSGASSRVLLNEKVYRLNETVDRNLSLKLTAVETDFLKFTDANGIEYQKSF
ncbi:MAG: hypothetical protein ABIZ81_15250 [Opitutaceae bacterium]